MFKGGLSVPCRVLDDEDATELGGVDPENAWLFFAIVLLVNHFNKDHSSIAPARTIRYEGRNRLVKRIESIR